MAIKIWDGDSIETPNRIIVRVTNGNLRFVHSAVVLDTEGSLTTVFNAIHSSTQTTTTPASTANSNGIIGTLRQNGFEWSETRGIQAPAVTSGFNYSGVEKTYHGDRDGFVENHDTGNSFNPGGTETNVSAE